MITRISLVIIPLMIMLFATTLTVMNLTGITVTQYNVSNQTINEGQSGIQTSPISFTYVTMVTVLIGSFVAIAIASAIHVFGSGISGSAIPIIFICGIGLGVWGVLSVLSLNLFLSIALIGVPTYFALTIMFIMGLVSLTTGGGD